MTHDEKIVEALEPRMNDLNERALLGAATAALNARRAANGWPPTSLDKMLTADREAWIEDVRAAITAYQAEAWQPIETAPKERGAKILGWCVYPAGAEVRFCQNAPAYTSAPGATRWEAYGMSQQVTHWQPLPPAPNPPASP